MALNWDIAELAYKYKVRLVNWPAGFTDRDKDVPRVGWKASAMLLAKALPLMRKRHKWLAGAWDGGQSDEEDAENAEDAAEVTAEDAPRIERWTDSEWIGMSRACNN